MARQHLGTFLAARSDVRSLRLQGMEITREDAEALGTGIQKYVKHVTFSGNGIGVNEGAMEKIVAILLCCDLLKSAAFQRCSLDDSHVPEVCRLLRQHASLSYLSLAW